jgi:hypothetical protein
MTLLAAMLALAAWVFGGTAAVAQETPTRIIDHFVFDNSLLTRPGQRRSSVDFDSKPDLGPVWVLLNYIGRPTGSASGAVTSFEVMPEGVKVTGAQSVMLFQAAQMANYEVDTRVILYVTGGPPRVFTPGKLKEYMTPEDFAGYMSDIDAERKRTKDWVQLIQIQHYNIPANEPGRINIELRTLENMQPLTLEVLIGQGPLPPGTKAYAERRNRSWFHRNQNFFYMIGAALLLAFLAFRFLMKR